MSYQRGPGLSNDLSGSIICFGFAMVDSWGEVGQTFSWDALQGLVPEQSCDVVIQLACIEQQNGTALGVIFLNNRNVRISGLAGLKESTMALTLMGARFQGVVGIPSFHVTPETLVIQHSPVCALGLHDVVELCAGIGIATAGMDFAGFRTKLAVELRPPFASVFSALHPDSQVLVGDINDPECLRKIIEKAPSSCSLFAGFNCQPYSKAGAQKGILDPRAASLHGVLRVGFYLRCPLIILECVVEAASNRHVQEELRTFTVQCGYHMSDVVLKLEDVWPCRRERWWVVLSAHAIGKIPLKPLPQHQFPVSVKQILPRPLQISQTDREQLEIVGHEYDMFVKFRPDLQSMMVALQGKCPTLLHSLGSQATECLCGCRDKGFAEAILSRGLFGIIMPIDRSDFCFDPDKPSIRHPHPNEAALLSAVAPRANWGCHHRLALAGIGQQANPIHALWIVAQVSAQLEFLFEGRIMGSPRSLLDEYIEDLLGFCKDAPLVTSQVDTRQPIEDPCNPAEMEIELEETPCLEPINECQKSPQEHLGDPSQCTIVYLHTSQVIVVSVPQTTTVGNLIAAEAALHGNDELFEVIDPASGCVLEAHALVQGKCVWVRSFPLPVPVPSDVPMVLAADSNSDVSPTLAFVVEEGQPQSSELPNNAHLGQTQIIHDRNSRMLTDDPLLALTEKQLCELQPPDAHSLENVTALLAQKVSSEVRMGLLDIQGDSWADDEIRWHMWQCMDRTTKTGVAMLDPIVATAAAKTALPNMLKSWFDKLSCVPSIIISAVCLDSHWTPFVWTWTADCLHAHSWDLPILIPNTKLLHDTLMMIVGAKTFNVRVLHRMDGTLNGCGVCAIRYIDHFLTGRMLPTSKEDIQYLTEVGKSLFRRHVEHALHITRPWCWGNGLDSQASQRLRDLLTQHGVPSDVLDQRLHLTIQAIGVGPLQKCLTGSAPWRSLKALANQCTPMHQLVLPDELQSVVAAKAKAGESVRRSKGRQAIPKGVPAKPPQLDPSKLTFDDGAFVSDTGAHLQAIQVSQLGPFAEGVALASLADVEPFLRSGQVVSSNCLGVFLLNVDESQLVTKLIWAQTRVALRCIANGEPMLLNGILIQMGKKHVVQARTKHVVEVQSLPAACLKIAIYRDGITGTWEEVANAPIRYILQWLEPLASCNQDADSCSCHKWHANNQAGVKDPIFDLWRRQWLSHTMKTASPMQADLFMVNIRYAKAVEVPVLQLSGLGGVFLEPRSLDAREPVNEYQVLWMQKQSMSDLIHLKQCNPGVLGIARLGTRLGLRIRGDDMTTLGKTLKPEAIFLGGGPRMDFELGPVPFGLDRAGLARLCNEWGWKAKPINPTKAVAGLGAVWHIQSCAEPPSSVVSLKGGADVVISKMAPKPNNPVVVSSAVASAETIGLCQFNVVPAPAADPWLVKDPWSSYASKVAPAKVNAIDFETSLQQVEQRIERAVLAKLPAKPAPTDMDQDMGVSTDDTHIRIQELEAQVSKLASGHQQLELKVDEAGRKTDAQISQLQHQMTAQLEGQGARIEDLFRGQMSQIESLLTKKARHE